MRFTIALFGLIFSLSASAGTPIPSEQLKTYVEAVKASLGKLYYCTAYHENLTKEHQWMYARDLVELFDKADSGMLDTTGTQPALTLSVVLKEDVQNNFYFTTSSDGKKITDVNSDFVTKTIVNNGTITNPVLVPGFVKRKDLSCYQYDWIGFAIVKKK